MSSLKILEICKKWGIEKHTHYLDFVDDMKENGHLKEEKVVIRCLVNTGNERVDELIRGISSKRRLSDVREELKERENKDLTYKFEETIELMGKLEDLVKTGAEAGIPVERSDWLQVGKIKYQLISKSYEMDENVVIIKFGFIKF